MTGELIMYSPFTVSIVLFLVGLVLAFFGNRVIPFALIFCALIAGFLHGGSILQQFTDNPDILRFGPPVIAVLLAVLVSFLYKAAFFAAGILMGFFVSTILIPDLSIVPAALIALVFGALVYLSRNFVFSVLTSVLGAVLTATGIVNLVAWLNISAGIAAYWVVVVVTAVAGLFHQTKRNRGRK